ncbi:MAG: hypothetical protein S4CHLAM102_14380 [Chlamydiia bacterium]|nr:hypothetical protein [Chlamydiia bacterium]
MGYPRNHWMLDEGNDWPAPPYYINVLVPGWEPDRIGAVYPVGQAVDFRSLSVAIDQLPIAIAHLEYARDLLVRIAGVAASIPTGIDCRIPVTRIDAAPALSRGNFELM